MQNEDDITKDTVLEYFNKLNDERPNLYYSPFFVATKLNQYPRQKVIAAINFLSDERFLKKKTEKGMEKFRISSKGVQQYSPSKYRTEPISPVSITANGGIFVMGSNLGTINQTTIESFKEINKLIHIINQSSISDNNKLELIGDAETLRSQLTKPSPNKSIVKSAWESLVKGAGVVKDAKEIHEAIKIITPIVLALI